MPFSATQSQEGIIILFKGYFHNYFSVRSDMDDGGGPLIAAHSYCSQVEDDTVENDTAEDDAVEDDTIEPQNKGTQ